MKKLFMIMTLGLSLLACGKTETEEVKTEELNQPSFVLEYDGLGNVLNLDDLPVYEWKEGDVWSQKDEVAGCFTVEKPLLLNGKPFTGTLMGGQFEDGYIKMHFIDGKYLKIGGITVQSMSTLIVYNESEEGVFALCRFIPEVGEIREIIFRSETAPEGKTFMENIYFDAVMSSIQGNHADLQNILYEWDNMVDFVERGGISIVEQAYGICDYIAPCILHGLWLQDGDTNHKYQMQETPDGFCIVMVIE